MDAAASPKFPAKVRFSPSGFARGGRRPLRSLVGGRPEAGASRAPAQAIGAPERLTSPTIVAQAPFAPDTNRTPTVALRPDCAVQQTTP